MPHDANDQELKIGDRVVVECTVASLEPGTEYCNVTLQTDRPMPPYTTPSSIILNTKQVRKL